MVKTGSDWAPLYSACAAHYRFDECIPLPSKSIPWRPEVSLQTEPTDLRWREGGRGGAHYKPSRGLAPPAPSKGLLPPLGGGVVLIMVVLPAPGGPTALHCVIRCAADLSVLGRLMTRLARLVSPWGICC